MYKKNVAQILLKQLFKKIVISSFHHSQSAMICSKLTIETLEQGVKYVES